MLGGIIRHQGLELELPVEERELAVRLQPLVERWERERRDMLDPLASARVV